MKKQNNIFAYARQTAGILFSCLLLHACTDEEIIKPATVEEGIPVEVGLKFSAPDMANISTRSLTGEDENNINDMYILVFDLNGNRIDGGGFYEKGSGFNVTTHNDNVNTGSLTLTTSSGERRIYGIANVKDNELNGKGTDWLLNELENSVNSVADLQALTLSLDITKSSISIDRISANMVMSGEFDNGDNAGRPGGYCVIPAAKSGGTISGKLTLTRLDSKITFEIRLGSKVTKFEAQEWQVFNVPVHSYIMERETDAGGTTDADNYRNSLAYNSQFFITEEDRTSAGGKKYSFTFYQLENLKNSKEYNGERLTDYKMREAEVKNSDGTNSGEYKFVEPYATYVQIKAYMETDQGSTSRVANIRAIVHLGGKDRPSDPLDPANFNNRRNKKYTYKVTINDADDIKTEVEMEDGNQNEPRPGIEGDVVDSSTEARILDAHYNCFNIGFTYNEVVNMGFMVYTPFAEVKAEYKEGDTDTKQPGNGIGDYKWVKFKYLSEGTSTPTRLAHYTTSSSYPDDDTRNERLNIYELRKDVMERGKNNPTRRFYYTVFVDEYYYKTPPCNGLNWGDNPKTYWTKFVNQDDRYIMLVYTPKKSTDQDSSYGTAQYFIRQKSIQTFYSTTNLTDEQCALGMEHINESPKLSTYGGSAKDPDNGYYNTYDYVGGKNWSSFVDRERDGWSSYYFKADAANNTFKMIDGITTRTTAACLSRNRDKNGDGKIDTDETEWYVPTSKQLSSMYLGAQSLPSPLFTPPATGGLGSYQYRFQTSNGDNIWADEGCSNVGTAYEDFGGEQIRCVRNLGIDASDPGNKEKNKVATPYKIIPTSDSRIIYDLNSVDPLNLRQNRVTTPLLYHVNFQETKNMPYYQFELAKNFLTSSTVGGGGNSWKYYDPQKKDLCSEYSQESGQRDKGTWRTPNQRELLIIYNEGSQDVIYRSGGNAYGMYSCTYWSYSGAEAERAFAVNSAYGNCFLDGGRKTNYGAILRCVRDVNITP